jgi:hypothetical protein
VLEGFRYVASGFWHNATVGPSAALAARDGVLTAFAPNTSQSVYMRALTMDGSAMAELTGEAIEIVNRAWGLPAIPIRRFTS